MRRWKVLGGDPDDGEVRERGGGCVFPGRKAGTSRVDSTRQGKSVCDCI